ncbi:PAC2 family protein [Mesorhizobium escarrei]|uniref:DUF6894 domain-containing protein n=1 Tax=Mesorhizobium escarrei TaxID=666018 RepID=A0ABM9DLT6_9HYPH|nr:PAC2 family protein [Mesorhizobium escarrei]CAH2397083.1 hypothetical protein MES5069_160055 [Mesorhizobium escarrei]
MPRFFFDFMDADDRNYDDQGTDLPEVETAKAEASRALAEIVKDKVRDGICRELAVKVRSDAGEPLLKATFKLQPVMSDQDGNEVIRSAWAALKLVRMAIEQTCPAGVLPSEEAVLLLHGPEPVHEGEALAKAIIETVERLEGRDRDQPAAPAS